MILNTARRCIFEDIKMMLNPKTKMFMLTASFLLLSGCKPPVEKVTGTDAPAPEAAVPEEVMPAVTSAPETIAPAAGVNNPAVINFQGFGPAKFGGNEESLRMSWGRPLNASKPAKGSTCIYLNPEVMPSVKRSIGFMFEDAKFVRYDVDDASQIAPGNIKVGDRAEQVMTAHAGRVESAPHKYIPKGRTLTVTPEDKSTGRLIFEIGEDGKVLSWRIGVPPQVFYVEGCG
jgi:hypothetical protein